MLVNMKEMLAHARANKYAVGLFNTMDTDMLEGVINAAEKMRSPVIIGTAEVLLPYGELKLLAPSIIAAAKRATVPVVVHFDHGTTFERTLEALQLGFSSVMFDASTKPYEQNVAETREIVKIAHAMGATVEGEIGHVGVANNPDDVTGDNYTTVEEAAQFLADTGVDALAVAVGTAHGAYKSKPKLSYDRTREIRESVDVPLVLHGGSGLTDDEFRGLIENGISKVNIFTDLCIAAMTAKPAGEAADLNFTDYMSLRKMKVDAIQAAAEKKMSLFGCAGKADI